MIELNYDQQRVSVEVLKNQVGQTEYQLTSLVEGMSSVEVSLKIPAINVANNWHPMKGFDSSLKADWAKGHVSMISQSAPVESFYDYTGQNILTLAVDELVNQVEIKPGIHEEDGMLHVTIFISEGESTDHRLLVIDQVIPFTEALAAVTAWWEKQLDLFPVTQAQRVPMYSTWYAFHQNVTDKGLLAELPGIKQLGMDTIIIDDGWQTEDTNRGYAYCGDWQVAPSKFADFKTFVSEMHQASMKIMVWFSVPFVGIHSRKWGQVKDKLLMYNQELEAGVIDIRYQENIDFLVDTYSDFIDLYQIDGLKLDFIDEFYEREDSPAYQEAMAYKTVEEALANLMDKIKATVLAKQPDFFVEFRQRYIGPAMRQFSNAFRVNDCPYSALSNRVGITDLRLISGETPVHSDMLMWHGADSSENIGLQLAASLFGVIQLSVKLAQQTPEQLATIRFYLEFARQHLDLLQLRPLSVTEPENLYGQVRVASDQEEITTNYSQQQIYTPTKKQSWLVNGTAQQAIYLGNKQEKAYQITIYNATGEIKESLQTKESFVELPQYPGGITAFREII